MLHAGGVVQLFGPGTVGVEPLKHSHPQLAEAEKFVSAAIS